MYIFAVFWVLNICYEYLLCNVLLFVGNYRALNTTFSVHMRFQLHDLGQMQLYFLFAICDFPECHALL